MAILKPKQRESIAILQTKHAYKAHRFHYNRIRVQFIDGLSESWGLRPGSKLRFPKKDHFIREIKTHKEYETSPFESEEDKKLKEQHFIVLYNEFIRAGFCDRRLKIHELIHDLSKEGWVNLKFPESVLLDDISRVKPIKHLSILYSRRSTPGFKTSMHFMDWGIPWENRFSISQVWEKPRHLFKAVRRVVRKKRDISRLSIATSAESINGVGHCFVPPATFLRLLQLIGIKNPKVLDLSEDCGNKIIATSAAGGQYFYRSNKFILNPGEFGEFLKMPIVEDDGSMFDVTFLNNFVSVSADILYDELFEALDRSKYVVAFARGEEVQRLSELIPPHSIIPCLPNNSVFIYKN